MDCPLDKSKWPYRYIDDGTRYGFYGVGIFWDYSNPNDFTSSCHVGFMISKGYLGDVDEGCRGTYDPPSYEPIETEMIIVRPRLKYPKR